MQNPIEHLSEYELRRNQNIKENESYLRRLLELKISRSKEHKMDHNEHNRVHLSTSEIETHSIRISAWLIQMIVEGLPEGMSWIQSLRVQLRRKMEVDKWFRTEMFAEIRNPLTVEAISTLFPNQCLAGDAIKLAIESLNLVLEPDTMS